MQTSELPLFNNMHIKYVICSNDFMYVYIIQEDNANCIVKADMKKHESTEASDGHSNSYFQFQYNGVIRSFNVRSRPL